MFKKLFAKYALQYGMRAVGMAGAIVSGALMTKFAVDEKTAAAIGAGVVAVGGVLLDKGVSWYQTAVIEVRADDQAAKVAIVAKETEVAIGPAKVEAAQIAYDNKKASEKK